MMVAGEQYEICKAWCFAQKRGTSPGSEKKSHRRLLFLGEMVCDEIDGALHGNSQIRKKTD
jgi:hypothetical protein